jgi:hypothetical protein
MGSWLCALVVSWSAAFGAAPPEHSAPLTGPELRRMVEELAPEVASVAGADFLWLPVVVLADRLSIAEVVRREQTHLLEDLHGMEPEEAQSNAQRSANGIGGTFAGKYGFLDGKLYVSPSDLEEAIAFEGAPRHLLRPMMEVVLAHELTHALQDQHLDLDQAALRAVEPDAMMALNCAVEGHAVWVHEQVGERRHLRDEVVLMSKLLRYHEPVRRRMDPDAFYQAYVYGFGRDFIAYHARHGGTEQVWRVLSRPPTATRMIVDPAQWDDPMQTVNRSAKVVMRRASRRLAGPDWRPMDSALGDFDVRDQLVRAGVDSALADDLDTGWNSRLVGGAMAGVELQVLRFNHPASAFAYVDGMLSQAQDTERLVGDDPHISAQAGRFERVPSDRSGRERFDVQFIGPAEHLGRVWVARGADVVVVVLVNAPASDRQVATAIQSVFRALGARRPAGLEAPR